jgi:hypothetical protein
MIQRVVAIYPGGESVSYIDGDVTGAPALVEGLKRQLGHGKAHPEGPDYNLAGYVASPEHFIAATNNLLWPIMPHFECEGVEPLAPAPNPYPPIA